MENFKLAGKAKTVFKLIELKAKVEQAKAKEAKKHCNEKKSATQADFSISSYVVIMVLPVL